MLRDDPWLRGPELFADHCATCHRFEGHDGLRRVPAEAASSSDLGGFASRSWVRGLLDAPMSDRYFGRMETPEGDPAHTRMAEWLRKTEAAYRADDELAELEESFDAVAAYLEHESLHPGALEQVSAYGTEEAGGAIAGLAATADGRRVLEGRQFFMIVCNECHRYAGVNAGLADAPDMLGYGSVEWIELMIAEADHELRYGSTAQMPRFAERLSPEERRLLAVWLHAARRTGWPAEGSENGG
jgi:ubiquinol-cytochrome c reductase cytochrome b subunit